VSAAVAVTVLALWIFRPEVSAQQDVGSALINVHDYGASGKAQTAYAEVDGRLVTIADGTFRPQDAGLLAVLHSGDSTVQPVMTRIAEVVNSTTARLATDPPASLRKASILWGSDDKDGVQKAVTAAEARGPGSTLYLPSGTYLIGSTGLRVDSGDISVLGDGPYSSVLVSAFTQGPILTVSAARVKLSRLGFDAGGLAVTSGLALQDAHSVEVDTCRIFRPGAIGIYLRRAAGIKIQDTILESPGNALGTGVLIEASSQIQIRSCTFRYLGNGVIAHVKHDDPAPPRDVGIYNSHFEMGWWLTVPRYTGAGPSVFYMPNSVFDSTSVFTALRTNATVRSLRTVASGNGSFVENTMTDGQGRFLSSGVRRGDLVESGTVLGVVADVKGETGLAVDQWIRDADRLPAVAQPSGYYTVYRCLIGKVLSSENHLIRVDTWRDWTGRVQTPAAGTRYEAAATPSNYPIHAEPGTRNFDIEHNTLVAGYSDQISMWGEAATVRGNTIRDGEDMGITLNGAGHEVADNLIDHQGAGGIFVGCTRSHVLRNSVSDTPWVNATRSDILGGIIVFNGAQNNTISDNTVTSRPEMQLRRFGLLISQRDKPVIGNTIENNRVSGHSLADILLSGVSDSANTLQGNTGVVRRKDANSDVLR
jgi:hypothetical protein